MSRQIEILGDQFLDKSRHEVRRILAEPDPQTGFVDADPAEQQEYERTVAQNENWYRDHPSDIHDIMDDDEKTEFMGCCFSALCVGSKLDLDEIAQARQIMQKAITRQSEKEAKEELGIEE